MTYPADIVIPVWNRPCETRACLASLVACSPEARIIMVNYGSERETERVLEEFAEALDDRAILVSTERNIGRIAALNLGIGLATAPVAVILQDDFRVCQGWLEPLSGILSSFPDVGMAIPLRAGSRCHPLAGQLPFQEMDHGSLGVMALRREMFAAIGGLDTEMDGGLWCLRDYSRRATSAGYRTVSASCGGTAYGEPQLLGSVARREERIRQGELGYRQRWGAPLQFCFAAAGRDAGLQLTEMVPLLLVAARQGHRACILADRDSVKMLGSISERPVHENIVVEALPQIFTKRALIRRLDKMRRACPELQIVSCVADFDNAALSVQNFKTVITEFCDTYYNSGKVV